MAKYNVENIKSVDEILDNNTNEDLGIQPMIFAPDEPRVTVTERVLNIPDELQTIGVENDNNVERIYFEIPRYFDEVNDLSEFNFYINYLNANQEPNQYHCTDVEVEGDNVVFSWLTSEHVYAYRGIVRFIVYAVATDNRKWNTTVAELNVLEGLETEGQIIDNNPDIINELINLQEQFEEALDTIEQQQSTIEAQQSTISSQQTTITNQQNKITEQQTQIDNAIDIMGDYEIVQDNPTQIRFKKGNGTYGDTVNLGDNLASKSMVNAGYDTYSGNSYSGNASDYGIEIGKASGNYEQEGTPTPESPVEPKFFEPKHIISSGNNLYPLDNFANLNSNITIDDDGWFVINHTNNTGGNEFFNIFHKPIKELKKNSNYYFTIELEKNIFIGSPILYINSLEVNSSNRTQFKNGDTAFRFDSDNKTVLLTTKESFDSLQYYLLRTYLYIPNGSSIDFKFRITLSPIENASFETYKSIYTTPLSLILRALPNGVKDTYENGVVTRRIKEITFDGSSDENWISMYNIGNTNRFRFELSNNLSASTANGICDKLPFEGNHTNDKEHFYTQTNNIFIFLNKERANSIEELRSYLQSNPIKVWYQLATPTTEGIELPIIPSYYPYTNAWHDSEVEASDLTWFINTYARNSEYTDEFLQKFFALQRTGKVYTVKFPLWNTSQSPVGEKLHHNVGLTCTPSTDTVAGQDDYESIPLFKTYDVNAYVDDIGKVHVTAFKGDNNFKDVGKVDVFVLGMSYYERFWEENGYWYYSRTDSPKDGYTIARECVGNDGRIMPYALYSKYVSGEIDGTLYSSKGLKPRRNMSYNVSESEYHKRGKYYGGGKTSLYKYLLTTFYLKYATLNTQSIMQGTSNYSYQYACAQAENGVKRVVLTTAQANNFVVGSYVSIGEKGSNSSVDRGNSYMHNIADSVKILSIESVGDSNSAINVDIEEPFDTTTTTYISTMHWRSGFSDDVLGRDGSPSSLTDAKHPMVLQGIETMVGGYEVMGNAIMDITSSTGTRKPYVINDNSKIIQSVTNIKSTYETSNDIQPTTLNAWNYITEMKLDIENGYFGITKAGVSGSGSAVGFCDGLYVDSGTSGQREFLAVGGLGSGSAVGLSYLYADYSLSIAGWFILSRLSI